MILLGVLRMQNNTLEALYSISPNIPYDEWYKIVASAKKAGLDEGSVRSWSQGGSNYNESDFIRQWNASLSDITEGTLFHYAKQSGFKGVFTAPAPVREVKPVEYILSNIPNDELIPFSKETTCSPEEQRATYFSRLGLKADDMIYATKNSDYRQPKNKCYVSVAEVIENTSYTHFKSDWCRESATNFKYVLVESDELSLQEQYRLMQLIRLPINTVVYSGSKSIHFMVKVDAKDTIQFKERADFLKYYLDSVGFKPDRAVMNLGRYTRLPGADAHSSNDKTYEQSLWLGVFPCKRNWNEWRKTLKIKSDSDDLDSYRLTEDVSTIKEQPWIIPNVLKKGKISCIAGGSKAGKSLLAMNLAMNISKGYGDSFLGSEYLKQKVLYIDTEMDADDWKTRSSIINAHENLFTLLINDYKYPKELNLLERLTFMINKIISYSKINSVDVVILDCIYAFINENDPREVTILVDALKRMKADGLTVIVIHHTKKAKYEGGSVLNQIAGHSNIGRAIQSAILLMERDSEFVFSDGTTSKHLDVYFDSRDIGLDNTVVYIGKDMKHHADAEALEVKKLNAQSKKKYTLVDRKKFILHSLSLNNSLNKGTFEERASEYFGESSRNVKRWFDTLPVNWIRTEKKGRDKLLFIGDGLKEEALKLDF